MHPAAVDRGVYGPRWAVDRAACSCWPRWPARLRDGWGAAELANRATEMLLKVPSLRLVPLDAQLGRASAQLAAELGLRGADATYVAVADHLGCRS